MNRSIPLLIAACLLVVSGRLLAQSTSSTTFVTLFESEMVHFLPGDSSDAYASPGVRVEENGRRILTGHTLPTLTSPHRIYAHLTLSPIPKSEREVHDRWDRAGSIRLQVEGQPEIELVRFMTAYGGKTSHTLEVTHLAPLLQGERTIVAFIDTWVSPAWRVDFALEYRSVPEYDNAAWGQGIYLEDSFNRQDMPAPVEVEVNIPEGLERVVMMYVSTGHCTDGIDDDEFVSKANVIAVDGVVVHRYYPWRSDCRQFRALNPYTARWSDGYWSSDYHRSGWCPGSEVPPIEIDLSDHLTPGLHKVTFHVEDVRPMDENKQYGYWRISSHLVGWDRKPRLWQNFEE